jgi:hypothetical protein
MPGEQYRLIFITGPNRTIPFTNPQKGGPGPRIPYRDRSNHSAYLRNRFERAWQHISDRTAVTVIERQGLYLEFAGEPGFDLVTKGLENIRSGVRLLNVRKEGSGPTERAIATVFVPNEKRGFFLNKITAYSASETPKGNPKNKALINSIADIRRAVVESFWQDGAHLLPSLTPVWVEVWLSTHYSENCERFLSILNDFAIRHADGILVFPERSVVMILANREQLAALIENSDDIAEFRLAKEVATSIIALNNQEQTEWAQELLHRTQYNDRATVAVAILDSGINNGHILIQPVLEDQDMHAAKPEWGASDDPHWGHGTLMAGTAIYGDLLLALQSTNRHFIPHCLESAKILPPYPQTNPKELWGYITLQGLSRAEIQAPDRIHIACMAITSSDSRDQGRPSSWSASIDEITSGYSDGLKRLFVISCGNVQDPAEYGRYPASNLSNQIHDPGQSWNALTVGAYTEKTRIEDNTLSQYRPIAPAGGLSPYSTTSVPWPARKWPLKPEVVFEGGNVALSPAGVAFETDDLQLLSTSHDPQQAQFAPFGQTSAAAAKAAWMAAQIQARYPEAWPETVRALLVHTAEWTEMMKQQFLPADPHKADFARLVRICGYGAPSLDRALYCAANSLTLISQTELQPFDKNAERYVTRDMHFYRLPWPVDALRDLGAVDIRMRVTLSYFVEPGPGEIGWKDRYRYPSHALRFEVNGPLETQDDFIRRINKEAQDEEGRPDSEGPGDRWLIGRARNVGSIHSDIWRGPAVELASSNLIGVYPAVGWWRERHHLGRFNKMARYSLIVSIYSPIVEVDIYTPVAIQIGIPIPVTIR